MTSRQRAAITRYAEENLQLIEEKRADFARYAPSRLPLIDAAHRDCVAVRVICEKARLSVKDRREIVRRMERVIDMVNSLGNPLQ